MSSPSPIQARAPQPDIRQSTSFNKHLKGVERTLPLRSRYENFIGGRWVAPAKGGYFDNVSPTTGQVICQIPRSQAEDVERALDAAHAAADGWAKTGSRVHPDRAIGSILKKFLLTKCRSFGRLPRIFLKVAAVTAPASKRSRRKPRGGWKTLSSLT